MDAGRPLSAPERTSRTATAIDQHAGLHVLGATLYALASGGPSVPGGERCGMSAPPCRSR